MELELELEIDLSRRCSGAGCCVGMVGGEWFGSPRSLGAHRAQQRQPMHAE